MTKDEYYKISREQKLSLRCPCLSTCARYRLTAFYVGRTCFQPRAQNYVNAMIEMNILGREEKIDKMLDAGEPVTYIGGSRSFWITNGCPEFFLHSHEHKLAGMKDLAVHQYSYDEEYRGDKFKPGEGRHYTECAEYALFTSKKWKSKTRKRISPKLRAELQKDINSQCPFCLDTQVGHFHIHHIDENPENNEHSNLIMVCPTCHSKITKGDIMVEQVREIKEVKASSTAQIECASINIDSNNCSWKRYEEPNSFYDEKNGKSRFPLLDFSLVNNLNQTLLLTEIELKAKYLPSGISGIPSPHELKSLATYRLMLPKENAVTRLKLDNEIVSYSRSALKITTELYYHWDGEDFPPDNRAVLFFVFKFSNNIVCEIPKVFLNCTNENSAITIYNIS